MLEFLGATKAFGPVQALDECTFTAKPGRLTGFLGPNGSGKTTAMRAVFGLLELDAGAVRWRGSAIGPAARVRFGYMPEERGLYPTMRVWDQLLYLGELCGRSRVEVSRNVDQWLQRLDLSGRAHDRLNALSHGNQQRVQLIAALVNDPDLLVLDEPFAGLDPLAVTSMCDLLNDVARSGKTVLFSSHQLELVGDLCDDVVVINRGRVVLAGDQLELRAAVPRRFVTIRFRGAAPEWSTVDGLEVVQAADGEVRLRVDQDIDVAELLILARSTTQLVSFAFEAPSLMDLFRAAVAA